MNPEDLKNGAEFAPDNPLFCTCDLAVKLLGAIYGEVSDGGKMGRIWMYKTEELFKKGKLQNKEYGCHYDYWNAKTGRLDFTRCQFPEEYYLYFYMFKKGFEVKNARFGRRMELLVPAVIEVGRESLNSLTSPTPEFITFLAR